MLTLICLFDIWIPYYRYFEGSRYDNPIIDSGDVDSMRMTLGPVILFCGTQIAGMSRPKFIRGCVQLVNYSPTSG